jgi:hypothetical protein
MTGTQIGQRIARDPVLAARLGNPQVSLTLYHNSGAQLVYAAPEDPLVWIDAALATGGLHQRRPDPCFGG